MEPDGADANGPSDGWGQLDVGESLPVDKDTCPVPASAALGDRTKALSHRLKDHRHVPSRVRAVRRAAHGFWR